MGEINITVSTILPVYSVKDQLGPYRRGRRGRGRAPGPSSM